MTTMELRARSTGHRIGWWVLIVINGVSIPNHLSGPFVGLADTDEGRLAFFALAALNAYALVVLATSYRRGDPWAWWVTWVVIAIYALTIPLYAPNAGPYYLGAAAVMAVAQLTTWSAFRQPSQTGRS